MSIGIVRWSIVEASISFRSATVQFLPARQQAVGGASGAARRERRMILPQDDLADGRVVVVHQGFRATRLIAWEDELASSVLSTRTALGVAQLAEDLDVGQPGGPICLLVGHNLDRLRVPDSGLPSRRAQRQVRFPEALLILLERIGQCGG